LELSFQALKEIAVDDKLCSTELELVDAPANWLDFHKDELEMSTFPEVLRLVRWVLVSKEQFETIQTECKWLWQQPVLQLLRY